MNKLIRQRLWAMHQDDGFKTHLVRGIIGVGGLKLVSLPLSLVASVLLARGLGPQGFGQYAFIMSLLTILALPLDQGMRELVTREVAGYHHMKKWALLWGLLRRTNQWVLLASGLIIVAVGSIAIMQASWQADDRWTLLLIALLSLPFLGLKALRSATLRGLNYVFKAQLPELLVRPGLFLALILVLLTTGLLNPGAALASQAMAALAAYIISTSILRGHLPKEAYGIDPDYRSGEWARSWAPFTLLMAATLLNEQIGLVLLGWLGTSAQVAALRVADRGAQLVIMSLAVIDLVIGPHITRAYRDGDRRRLQQIATQSARAALGAALPVALPLMIFGHFIVALVFGTNYVDLAVSPLAILCGAQLINVAFGSVNMFLLMSGYEHDTLLGQLSALILETMAAIVLIPAYGANGAAFATAIAFLSLNLILAIRTVQRLGLRPTVF